MWGIVVGYIGAYHIAALHRLDVHQARNLAKSVTVE